MKTTTVEASVKGKPIKLPAVCLHNRSVVCEGKWLRKARIHDEEWLQGEPVENPEAYVRALTQSKPVADIFSFSRALPATEISYPYHVEWENVAAVRLTKFSDWWNGLPQESRKNVRRSERRGVTVRRADFDDDFIRGISAIYDEIPVRQGRPFWHYRKSFAKVKVENSSYLDCCDFIGAYFQEQLIGFIKVVRVNQVARLMQIVSMEQHTDKRTTNALLAKGVEISCEKNASHFIYGRYVYGTKESSPLTEFKRRNGFERVTFPRYYIPLTWRGSLAIRWGLHKELAKVVPEKLVDLFLAARGYAYKRTALTKVGGSRCPGGDAGNETGKTRSLDTTPIA